MSACPTTSPDLPTDLRPEPRPELLSEAVDIRPLAEHDAHLVSEVFEGLSPLSRFLRFHTPTPRLSRTLVQALAAVSDGARGAFVALDGGRAVGLAQWARDPGCATRAELAVAVVDAHQGHGVGRRLLGALAEAMPAQGIHELVCVVHSENRLVAQALRRAGAHRDPDGSLVIRVAHARSALRAAPKGKAPASAVVLPWADAVPRPRTPAGGEQQRR